MHELPPILTGSEAEQLRQLRDYLVRLARELDAAESAPAALTPLRSPAARTGAAANAASPAEAADSAEQLRALIVKTARQVTRYADELNTALAERYLAISDFGRYAETVDTSIRQTARETVESYRFSSELAALRDDLSGYDRLLTDLEGRILRGVLTDPEGRRVFGIAVAEKLSVTGEIVEADGLRYEVLSPGQTLGLYTAGGWQFWLQGVKTGWFDAADGLLHVSGVAVEQSLRLGPWLLTADGGLGLRAV